MSQVYHSPTVIATVDARIDPASYITPTLRSTFRLIERLTRNKIGSCFASMKSLAAMMGKGDKTARRHVAALCRLNIIRKVLVPGGVTHLFILPPGDWNVYPDRSAVCPSNVQTQYTDDRKRLAKKDKQTRTSTPSRKPVEPAPPVVCQEAKASFPDAAADEQQEQDDQDSAEIASFRAFIEEQCGEPIQALEGEVVGSVQNSPEIEHVSARCTEGEQIPPAVPSASPGGAEGAKQDIPEGPMQAETERLFKNSRRAHLKGDSISKEAKNACKKAETPQAFDTSPKPHYQDSPAPLTPEQQAILQALVTAGVAPRQARTMVDSDAQRAEACVKELRREIGRGQVIRDAGGWLMHAFHNQEFRFRSGEERQKRSAPVYAHELGLRAAPTRKAVVLPDQQAESARRAMIASLRSRTGGCCRA